MYRTIARSAASLVATIITEEGLATPKHTNWD